MVYLAFGIFLFGIFQVEKSAKTSEEIFFFFFFTLGQTKLDLNKFEFTSPIH